MKSTKNIVILGAGFGGLKAAMTLSSHAKYLKKKGFSVILVDQNDYHTYTPTLYEIAATSKESANYTDLKSVNTFPLKQIFAGRNIKIQKAKVESIDIKQSKVLLHNKEEIPYSHLIISLGAQVNFFNIPNLEKNALTLKTFTDALKLRESVFAKACSGSHNQKVEVLLGGAGPTGVELAAELQEWFAQIKKEGIECEMGTTLINASPQILRGMDKRVIQKSLKRLKKLGVNIVNNARIQKVIKDYVVLDSGAKVRFDSLIWTGGVRINELLEQTGFKIDGKNGIEVSKSLEVQPKRKSQKLNGKIYAIGDANSFYNPHTKKPVPHLARPAISQGKVAAQNVLSDIKDKPAREFKTVKEYPYVVPVGGKYAVTKVGAVVLSGFMGWVLKGLIELNYISSIMPKRQALSIWLKGLRIFIQNDRLG